jgi:hypothetical protein
MPNLQGRIGRRPRALPLALALVALSAIAYAAIAGPGAAAPQAPPENVEAPQISGTPRVGQTLTGSNGTWENSPTAFQYQWLRCETSGRDCRNVLGAVQRTYRLVAADEGRTMRFRVTAVNVDGATTVRSEPTAVVTSASGPRNTSRPTISGETRVGEALTANDGSWTGNPTGFSYQWQRCDVDAIVCGNVPGATGKAYGVRAADVGFRLRVEVTARNAAGTGTARSAPSGIVVPSTPITNARPTIGIISIRFTGARVYARVRICDDQPRNLGILVRETKRRVRPANRRFATRAAPRPCGAYTRSWIKPLRFRQAPGRYTITLRARDAGGNTSRPASRTFRR